MDSIEQITPDHPLSQSADIVGQNIEALKQLFPEVFTEGKVDFEKLKETLGDYVETKEERFNFIWAGKQQARREAQKPSTGTLRPCPEESVNWDKTQNLYIEGDNLEVLKLLQKSYYGKVKMIYIDPPYNTGKDFVYKDNYRDNLQNYLEMTGQTDEKGRKFSTNSDTSGRYHSDWLSMMYPRLKLARNLLREDGVIFISIDDNEVENLKLLCESIFGPACFIEQIAWKNKYGAGAKTKGFISVHEYILCYSKHPLSNIEVPLSETEKKAYSDRDENFQSRGGFFTQPLMTNSMADRENLKYSIFYKGKEIKPRKQWVWSESRLKKAIERGEVVIREMENGEFSVRSKQYLYDYDGKERLGKPLSLFNGPFTQEGTKEIKDIFQLNVFGFPKPTRLLRNLFSTIINEQLSKGDIILDFFGGSSSSADSVLHMNMTKNNDKKFILVQLPEPTDEKSEAYKAGYKTIAEIGKERIRRVIKKIEAEAAEDIFLKERIDNNELDLGFKVFKLDSSNIRTWDPNPDSLQADLFNYIDHIKPDRSSEDLLYEILLKYGLDLTVPIETLDLNGNTVFNVGKGALWVCLDSEIPLETVTAIGEQKQALAPEVCRVVFKDSGFKDDAAKTNALQTLKRFGISEVRSI